MIERLVVSFVLLRVVSVDILGRVLELRSHLSLLSVLRECLVVFLPRGMYDRGALFFTRSDRTGIPGNFRPVPSSVSRGVICVTL